MFGIWEVFLILGVLFAVTFGGGLVLVAARALADRRRPDPLPEADDGPA